MNQATAQATATVGDALANARQLLLSHPGAAARQAQAIIKAEPGIAEAHLILAAVFRLLGRFDEAEAAEREGIRVSGSDPVLMRAAALIASGRDSDAEDLLRRFLDDTPNDPQALRLLADVARKAGKLKEGEQLLWRALKLAPSFATAREEFFGVLEEQALAYSHDPTKPDTPPEGEEEFRQAIALNEQAIVNHGERPGVWLSYGHALRMAGRHEDSIAAYRHAIELNSSFGEAWWGLADLKTSYIGADDRALMTAQLETERLSDSDRIGIHFALGKALADGDLHEEAFGHYAEGNALKRRSVRYDVQDTLSHVEQCKATFTAEHFSRHRGQGHEANDPIFIVGMPRSGSTLVEQILSSHPSIEGTEELVYFGNLSSFLSGGRRAALEPSSFVDEVSALSPAKLQTIGGAYLWKANRHRRSNRPRFIDKMPRNWLYLPLIKLALPNAKIIDVRRHPLDCCWSNFRQLFADSGEYSYDLTELGLYYRAYVEMLAHFGEVLPGSVYRLHYEQLVANTESEVRRLLDHLELPFDPACLKFHENPRAVKTASSEQVRRPIGKSGIDQWMSYEPWLAPLKVALGSVLDCYPEAPENWN